MTITGGKEIPKAKVSASTAPCLTGDPYVDLALWRLSAVLREISAGPASDAEKETPPHHAPAAEGLTNSEEAVSDG